MENYLLAIFAGILLGIPFKFPSLALLAWVGLIPLLFALENNKGKASFKLGWTTGMVFLAISSYWLLISVANFSDYPLIVSTLIFVVAIAIISLYFGLFALLLNSLKGKISILIITPLVWTGVEFLRTVFSFQFLFAFLGYSQAFIPQLIQLAQYGGVYLVTFIISLVNTLLYVALKERKIKYLLTAALIFALLFTYGNTTLKQEVVAKKEFTVGVMQPNIPQEMKLSRDKQGEVINKILNLTSQELAKGDPDLMIWPETAILRGYYEDRKFPYAFYRDNPLFIGGHIRENGHYLNSAFLVDSNRDIVQRYSKVKLVPWGEYVPFPKLIPDIIETTLNHITPGNKLVAFNLKGVTWISPICSEILNPFYIRKLYQQNDFMINISNEAWFGKSHASLQVLQAAIFRAVEHRTPVVKVGNTGISGVISQRGEILARTKIFKTKTFTFNLPISERKETFYDKFGDVFGWLNLIVTVSLLIIHNRNKINFFKNINNSKNN
ncbi:Apolipoprotein N-acyltransferase [Orenia metallireducens]|uniref:Apolipoprotein N-acyltransferase n=1 Tax=Orenia metallireducens TaxID=1413210 RepID=A0A285F3I5_9FIRM|nr:apolipoprotein N-acyltransferase [Orenia metallireducens]SNY05825.1 Apolipoprotein N-acyltransferase [Orenia metallireducens]